MVPILFLLLGIVIVIFCAVLEYRKWRIVRTKIGNYANLHGYPIVGVGLRFVGMNNEEVMRSVHQMFFESSYTPFRAWFGPSLIVGIDDPEDMRVVLNSDQCLDKPYFYSFMRNETGLLTSTKEVWKFHRRALNPTLNTKMVISFVPVFNQKAKVMVDRLESSLGKSLDIYRPLFKCLSDTILNTALGMNCIYFQTKRGDMLHDMFTEIFTYFQHRMVRIWCKWDSIYALTSIGRREKEVLTKGYQFLRSIGEIKAMEYDEKLEEGIDVLQLAREANHMTWIQKCFLLYRQGKFSEQNLTEEIDTIYVGGSDTTTTTLTGAIVMMAIHQDIQDKVVEELRAIYDSADSPVSFEDLSKMTYLEMVIKEAMRHFPVGPFIAREASDDLPLRDGIIPKGSIVLLNISKMHKDPKIWGPHADSFYPDHFLPENISSMHPYSFLPFSGGPRNCIGIKYAWCASKIMLAYLLRRYKFTTDLKYEDVRTKVNVILKIVNHNPVRLERREF